jgi:Ca-activated chloride channel homolog
MTFVRPALFALVLVPIALAATYVVLQRRRPKYAVRFTNLALLDVVAPKQPAWRRHLPAAALVVGLLALVVGLAGPAREQEVAERQSTVMLALDVSLSMQATDVEPSRLEALKAAAASFIESAPKGMRIGLVSFAETATVAVAPTDDLRTLDDAVASLRLRQGTAIGEAIFASLDALVAAGAIPPPPDAVEGDGADGAVPPPTTRAPDDAPPARIVVMSDGTTTAGRPNEQAVAAALESGVPVSTIAFGTASGMVTVNGETVPVPVDPPALQAIAQDTGGRFYAASSAAGLAEVFDDIGGQVQTSTELVDLSPWFTGAALALLSLAAVGSLVWFSRLP